MTLPLETLAPELLAFLAVLAAAAGADLALALLVLGVAPLLGWADPPGTLSFLQSPVVIASVAALYVAEGLVERFAGGFALWHTFQRWVRVLGLLLVALMATSVLRASDRGILVALMTLLGMGVYVGASGWEGLLILRRLPGPSQRLAALAIDVAFGALLVLSLDEPLQAGAALLALLLLAAFQLPMAVRAHVALVRAGKAWLHALVLPGRWVAEDDLPGDVRAAVAVDGPIPGKPLRGARASLLGKRLHLGWLVLSSQGAFFVGARQGPMPLTAPVGTRGERGTLHVRKPVLAAGQEGELLVLRDGPGVEDLEMVIPRV